MNISTILTNSKSSYTHIPYTAKHIWMVYKLQLKYLHWIKYPFHDFDKLLMYIFVPWLGSHKIHNFHRNHRAHHVEFAMKSDKNFRKFYKHLDEAVIDWESARFTKPDKPLNAWQTCIKYYPDLKESVRTTIDRLGIPA